MLGKIKSFIRSKKPVVVNCYTPYGFMYEHAQMRPARDFVPKWLKDVPVSLPTEKDGMTEGKTIRICSGLNQLLDVGYVIPMWCDLKVKLGDNTHAKYKWMFSEAQMRADIHPQEQRGDYLPDTDYSHMKLVNHWAVHCDEPIQFAMIDNTWLWDKPDDIIVPAGVIDFHYQHGAHVNVFFKRGDKDKEILIPHGQPLAQLIPLTNRKVIFKHHLVSDSEYQKMLSFGGVIKFHGSEYHKRKNKNRCPYSVAKEMFKDE